MWDTKVESSTGLSVQFQFCRPQFHTAFQDILYYFPSINTKFFLVLFRRKTTKIRIRKKRKMTYTKMTKNEENKAMKEYKKSKKRIRRWRIRRQKET